MFPGMNSRQARQMMQRMGIAQQDIDASQVIIICKDKHIIIDQPEVAKINMMGQEVFQIGGTPREEAIGDVSISEDDIKTVMEQAQVEREVATAAIKKHKGDLAEAILSLQK